MRAKVKVRPSEGEGFEVEIANTATIGRSRDNTISLHFSPHVSRQHAIIRCHNAYEYQLMDLGSRNGTFVDGRRVITPVTLRHGSVIRITSNELLFEQIEDAPGDGSFDATLAAGTDTGLQETADVAIMVCDIRGFSTMSEVLPEEVLARTLGEWFRTAGDLVHSSGGTIDKFIGDALLAYWSAAEPAGSYTRAALDVAFALLDRSRKMKWPGHDARPFRIAVALHCGSVACGNIGLVAQRDATIIGDAVNTAFRIEAVMKQLNKALAFSDDFLAALDQAPANAIDLGEHQLKGKNQAVRLFAVER